MTWYLVPVCDNSMYCCACCLSMLKCVELSENQERDSVSCCKCVACTGTPLLCIFAWRKRTCIPGTWYSYTSYIIRTDFPFCILSEVAVPLVPCWLQGDGWRACTACCSFRLLPLLYPRCSGSGTRLARYRFARAGWLGRLQLYLKTFWRLRDIL